MNPAEHSAFLFAYNIACNPDSVVMAKPQPSSNRIYPMPLGSVIIKPTEVRQYFLHSGEGKVNLYREKAQVLPLSGQEHLIIQQQYLGKDNKYYHKWLFYEKSGEIEPQFFEKQGYNQRINGEYIPKPREKVVASTSKEKTVSTPKSVPTR